MIVMVVMEGISKGVKVFVTVTVGAGLVTVTGEMLLGVGTTVVVDGIVVVEAGSVVERFRVVVLTSVVLNVEVSVEVEIEVIVVGCKICC